MTEEDEDGWFIPVQESINRLTHDWSDAKNVVDAQWESLPPVWRAAVAEKNGDWTDVRAAGERGVNTTVAGLRKGVVLKNRMSRAGARMDEYGLMVDQAKAVMAPMTVFLLDGEFSASIRTSSLLDQPESMLARAADFQRMGPNPGPVRIGSSDRTGYTPAQNKEALDCVVYLLRTGRSPLSRHDAYNQDHAFPPDVMLTNFSVDQLRAIFDYYQVIPGEFKPTVANLLARFSFQHLADHCIIKSDGGRWNDNQEHGESVVLTAENQQFFIFPWVTDYIRQLLTELQPILTALPVLTTKQHDILGNILRSLITEGIQTRIRFPAKPCVSLRVLQRAIDKFVLQPDRDDVDAPVMHIEPELAARIQRGRPFSFIHFIQRFFWHQPTRHVVPWEAGVFYKTGCESHWLLFCFCRFTFDVTLDYLWRAIAEHSLDEELAEQSEDEDDDVFQKRIETRDAEHEATADKVDSFKDAMGGMIFEGFAENEYESGEVEGYRSDI